jgi:hypothetical protein
LAWLKRRNVFRVSATHVVANWLIIQVGLAAAVPLNLPDWCETVVVVLLVIGFPVAVLFAWALEVALATCSIEARLTPLRAFILWYPVMSDVRKLPAFKDLVAEMNLVEYWRAHGWPDHCRPTGGTDFECF